MSDKDFSFVLEKCAELNNASHSIGCTLEDPFMTMAFMSLPVIPELKVTDKGIFDTNKFDFFNLSTKERSDSIMNIEKLTNEKVPLVLLITPNKEMNNNIE